MKRERIDIMAQILMFCAPPRRKTSIMYKNNLSYAQLKNYLTLLSSHDLLAHKSDTYVTTEKGQQFLQAFAQLKEVLEDRRRSSFLEISESYEVRAMLDGFPTSRNARELKLKWHGEMER